MKFNTENPMVRDELWIKHGNYSDYPVVRNVYIEIDTSNLSFEEESDLIAELEDVSIASLDDELVEEFYREVKEVQQPEFIDDDAEDYIAGKLIYKGRIADYAEDTIYKILNKYDVDY